jgi:hypothetical protein
MRWPFFEAGFLLRDPALDSRIDKNPLPEDVRKQLPGLAVALGELKRFPTRVRFFSIFLSRLRFLLQASRNIKRAQATRPRCSAAEEGDEARLVCLVLFPIFFSSARCRRC